MIVMTIVARVKDGKRGEFLQIMRSLHSDRENPKGLEKSAFYQELDDPTGFSLIHEWETQKDLDRYLADEEFKVLLGALKILCEKSEIRYSPISEELPDWGLSE
jgi:quinol monooxygenase YgiN